MKIVSQIRYTAKLTELERSPPVRIVPGELLAYVCYCRAISVIFYKLLSYNQLVSGTRTFVTLFISSARYRKYPPVV